MADALSLCHMAPRLKPKSDRRDQWRDGLIEDDPRAPRCTACGSLEVEHLQDAHEMRTLRCRECRRIWVAMIPRQ
jgi:hypothetical protein